MIITAQERDLYDTIWALPSYSLESPGERYVPIFMDMNPKPGTLLDAGCGTGKGALALAQHGFDVTLCDITPDGVVEEAQHLPFAPVVLWNDMRQTFGYLPGGKFDWVYCCDVMEHIPTAFTMLTVARMLQIARCGLFLTVCHIYDNFGVWTGGQLHKTVEPYVWWRDNLAEIGEVVEARDLLTNGAFMVRAR